MHNTAHFLGKKFVLFNKFVRKPHVFCGELPAVKIRENAAVGGEIKFKLVGIKRLSFDVIASVHPVDAVLSVTQQRAADISHMRPYLVSSARHQLYLRKGKSAVGPEHTVLCYYSLVGGCFFVGNGNGICLAVLKKIMGKGVRLFGRNSHKDTKIFFLQLSILIF